jgi:hypothetical protein
LKQQFAKEMIYLSTLSMSLFVTIALIPIFIRDDDLRAAGLSGCRRKGAAISFAASGWMIIL